MLRRADTWMRQHPVASFLLSLLAFTVILLAVPSPRPVQPSDSKSPTGAVPAQDGPLRGSP
jgi:hypothetical protein